MKFIFKGGHYTLCDNWHKLLPLETFTGPINYLEIGAYYGGNLIEVAKTYGKHPDSKLFAVDPWEDYDDYPEYKEKQGNIHETFMENIRCFKEVNDINDDKFTIVRGYSHKEVPKFKDNYFDVIYIDANHEPEYVLEDAIIAFRKVKVGGYMIFDDYGWGGPDMTKKGIDAFISGYHKRIETIGLERSQMIVKRTK
uniref:Methyltransferase n=1 Tax=viral metagenome TaxID=1070528 RepID=A0A6C0E0V9_9ZZZZ